MKTYMFQYYNSKFGGVIEDTKRISHKEAVALFDKYYDEAVQSILDGHEVQMAIWSGCKNDTDYSTMYADLDSRDIHVVNNKMCKIKPICKEDFFCGHNPSDIDKS